jgi:hypothetical protein
LQKFKKLVIEYPNILLDSVLNQDILKFFFGYVSQEKDRKDFIKSIIDHGANLVQINNKTGNILIELIKGKKLWI